MLTNDTEQIQSSQIQSSMRPVDELLAVNLKTMGKLAELQTQLFNDILEEGVTYFRDICSKRDLANLIEAQKSYTQHLQERFMISAKDVYSIFTDTEEQTEEALEEVLKPIAKAIEPVTEH